MRTSIIWLARVFALAFGSMAVSAAEQDYAVSSSGTRVLEARGAGIELKVLVEAVNLGGSEVEVGELVIPPNYDGSPHVHQLEIFYVLEGVLHHIVNGEAHVLTPGMIGIVRAPDKVIHKTTEEGAKALVIWPQGGEVAGLARIWAERPIENP